MQATNLGTPKMHHDLGHAPMPSIRSRSETNVQYLCACPTSALTPPTYHILRSWWPFSKPIPKGYSPSPGFPYLMRVGPQRSRPACPRHFAQALHFARLPGAVGGMSIFRKYRLGVGVGESDVQGSRAEYAQTSGCRPACVRP